MKYNSLKYVICVNLVVFILAFGCNHYEIKESAIIISDSLYLKNLPSQPGEDSWQFIEDLKAPMWTQHMWEPTAPSPQQADLSKGVTIEHNYPDPDGRLETAYEDLRSFLAAGNIAHNNGSYIIVMEENREFTGESFRIDIRPDVCHIYAGNVDGIRRGIFQLAPV